MTTEATPGALGSNDQLGLAPGRAGQPRMMTIIDGAQEDETGHWYSPDAVRELLAADRAKWRELAQRVAHQGNARGLEGLAVRCTVSESGAVVSWDVDRRPNE